MRMAASIKEDCSKWVKKYGKDLGDAHGSNSGDS